MCRCSKRSILLKGMYCIHNISKAFYQKRPYFRNQIQNEVLRLSFSMQFIESTHLLAELQVGNPRLFYFRPLLHNLINFMTQNLPTTQENKLDVSGYLPPDEQLSKALSYSMMAAEIDQQERMSYMSKEQPHDLQQNGVTSFASKMKEDNSERQASIGGNGNESKQIIPENLFGCDQNQSNRFITANGLQRQRNMNDISKNDITKQQNRSINNDILNNFDQSNISERIHEQQLKPEKCLGQKIVSSVVLKNEQDLGNIAEESEIIQDHQSASDASHFISANLDFSDSKPKSLKAQEQYVITITKTKQNQESPTKGLNSQLDSRKLPQPQAPLFCCQVPVKDQKNSLNEVERRSPIQQSNHAVKGSLAKPKEIKTLVQSKLITNSKEKAQLKEQHQKKEKSSKAHEQNGEKKSNIAHTNRMKSSYDPTLGKTQYKAASVAKHFSQPDNYVSKEEQAKKSMIKLEQSLSKEEKNLNFHGRQNLQKKTSLQNEMITLKDEFFIKEQPQADKIGYLKLEAKRSSKQEKKEEKILKMSRKIQTMKSLAPQELFSGLSSIESKQKLKIEQQQAIKRQPKVEKVQKVEKVERVQKIEKVEKKQQVQQMDQSEQINYLKQKIALLQKKINMTETSKKNSHSQNSKNIRRIRSVQHEDEEREGKQLEVNFKDYNQTSIAKILKKQKFEKKMSSEDNNSHEFDSGFSQISDIAIPRLQYTPRVSDSPQKLANLGIVTVRSFDITNKNITLIEIKRYKDGVQYYFQEIDCIITWEFSGNFYLGSCSHVKCSGFREKEGEGIEYSPGNYIYKGNFSKNMKHGIGTINFAIGDKYEGQWRKDLYHGYGRLQANNSKYEGQFEAGRKQGQGKECFSNGDAYIGPYSDDKFEGKGKYYWKHEQFYNGQFKNGFMEGRGKWKSEEGDTYEGSYYRNMKHGYGTYRWRCGRQYHGKFQHGYPASTNNTRNIIPPERSIPIDFLTNQQSEQLYEKRVSLPTKEETSKRFTIRSLQSISPQRRLSPKKYIYNARPF